MEGQPRRIDVPKGMSYTEFTFWAMELPTGFYGPITGPDDEQGFLSVIRDENYGAITGWRRIPTGLHPSKIGLFITAARDVHDLELQRVKPEVLKYAQDKLDRFYSGSSG